MLRIAFATGDGAAVDQHFGWCDRFDVYEVTPDGATLVGTRPVTVPEVEGHTVEKIDVRVDAVRDCAILQVCAIGAAAAARVVNAGVMPVKVPEGTPVPESLEKLRTVLAGNPPPWLRRLLGPGAAAGAPARSGWSPS